MRFAKKRLLFKDFEIVSFRKYRDLERKLIFEKLKFFEKQRSFRKNQRWFRKFQIFENTRNNFRNYTISKINQKSKYFSFLYKREKTEYTIRKSRWSQFTRFRNSGSEGFRNYAKLCFSMKAIQNRFFSARFLYFKL